MALYVTFVLGEDELKIAIFFVNWIELSRVQASTNLV